MASSLRPTAPNFWNGRQRVFGAGGYRRDAGQDFSMDRIGPSDKPVLRSPTRIWQVLHLIEPAAWSVNKTEAIDPASDFWWIDDDPSEQARQWLVSHNRQDRLIEVSCDRDSDALLNARSLLQSRSLAQ
jgi:hypothetical protein